MPKEQEDTSLDDIIGNKPSADDRLDGNAPEEPFGEEPEEKDEAAKAAKDEEGDDKPEPGDDNEDEQPKGKAKADKGDAAAGLTKGILGERTRRQAAEKERDDLRKRLEALERGQQQPQPAPQAQSRAERPDPKRDPEGAARWDAQQADDRAWNDRVNLTQSFMKRTVGAEEYQAKEDVFLETYANDPAMMARLRQSPNPAEFAYEEGRKIIMQREIGDDPAAYRERLRAELLQDPEFIAEVRKQLGADDDEIEEEKPRKPAVPNSLGKSNSAAPRSPQKVFDGDAPLADILNGVGN